MVNDTEEHFLALHTHAKALRYHFSGRDRCRNFDRAAHTLIISHHASAVVCFVCAAPQLPTPGM